MVRSWICTRRWSRWAVQGEVEILETYLYIRVQSMAWRSEVSRFILESIESEPSCLRFEHCVKILNMFEAKTVRLWFKSMPRRNESWNRKRGFDAVKNCKHPYV